MLENQIATDLNAMYLEVTGQPGTLTSENLAGIVDVGNVLLSSNYREKYVNALFNVIGRYEFVDRPYEGGAPNIRREAWEWGSIMSKSRTKDFDAVPNKTWDLVAGQSVDNQIFNPPEVQTTLYNEMVCWEIDCSFVMEQLRQSFHNANEYDRFQAMLRSTINNNNVSNLDQLTMRCYNGFIAHRLANNIAIYDIGTDFNTTFSTSLTADNCMYSPDFNKFLAYKVLLYKNRMRRKVANFSQNTAGYTTFTPAEYSHTVFLDAYSDALQVYLESDTYHDDMVKIGAYESVSNWQANGSGIDYQISTISGLDISDVPGMTAGTSVQRSGILGLIHDRDALGIINQRSDVEVFYNPRGQFWNNFYKNDTRLFMDPAENGIIFVFGSGT